ncbi:hypothetical protein ACGFZH_40200 [Streptomyces zaomyceticus]|uniref:hypothetical protein n=2 Tax=Streptomyces zaomyceticus TaxID=68286 RepID=UPI0037243FF4
MSPKPTFEDVANPTPAEMAAWAYAPEAQPPVAQDWDIIATRPAFGSLFLTFAADRRCPQRRFFLSCLYLLAGDAVRTRFWTMPEAVLSALTDEAMSVGEAWVGTWGARTRALLRSPESFEYEDWCDPSGLASTPT